MHPFRILRRSWHLFILAVLAYLLFFSYLVYKEVSLPNSGHVGFTFTNSHSLSLIRRSTSIQGYTAGVAKLIELLSQYSDNWIFKLNENYLYSPQLKLSPFELQPTSSNDDDETASISSSLLKKLKSLVEKECNNSQISDIAEYTLSEISRRNVHLEDGSLHIPTSKNLSTSLLFSTLQVLPLLKSHKETWTCSFIEGVIKRHQYLILQNPYASSYRLSFERVGDSACTVEKMDYTPDNLASFIHLSYKWWKASNRTEIFTLVSHHLSVNIGRGGNLSLK